MVPVRYLLNYVKGYELSDEKIGKVLGFDGAAEWLKVNRCVRAIVRRLDDEGYEALAVARRLGTVEPIFVLVLDDDNDLERLRERLLTKPLHPSIKKIMDILEGPDVFESIS